MKEHKGMFRAVPSGSVSGLSIVQLYNVLTAKSAEKQDDGVGIL